MPNWPIRLPALSASVDAVVGEGQRLGLGVDGDLDDEGRAVGDEFGIGDGFVTKLLAGVGGVGDEFANENVALGINGMHHQVQQSRNVGLEFLSFDSGLGRGRRSGFGGQGIPSWRGFGA
jgi:hypothetical protein